MQKKYSLPKFLKKPREIKISLGLTTEEKEARRKAKIEEALKKTFYSGSFEEFEKAFYKYSQFIKKRRQTC